MRLRIALIVAPFVVAMSLAAPVSAALFFFSTGNPDGRLGALSQQASSGSLETETADDFILSVATVINKATITGLIPLGTPLANITNIEVELYHVFPKDSAFPPSGNVPTRVNSPADVEIATDTRDGSAGTLSFTPSLLNSTFLVPNTVVKGINKIPNQTTGGEGPADWRRGSDCHHLYPSALPVSRSLFLPPGRAGDQRRFSPLVGSEADRPTRDAICGRLASVDS
jgi:hypothetical protein